MLDHSYEHQDSMTPELRVSYLRNDMSVATQTASPFSSAMLLGLMVLFAAAVTKPLCDTLTKLTGIKFCLYK